MMQVVTISLVLIGASSTLLGCKKNYAPPATSTDYGYLVVEGVVNAGTDSTDIKLSRTVKISSKNSSVPERGAIVMVEGDQNTTYPLIEATNGNYVSAGLNLDNAHKYRLHIKTTDGKDYMSDFVQVVNSPPIDSINYVIGSDGFNVYANTHDPQNNTHYYRWTYEQTWIIHSFYFSQFASNGDTVLARDEVNNNIFRCWRADSSSAITLASSAKLTKDVIVNNKLVFVSDTSQKITEGYSIKVTQYGLTSDAYNFWTALKKNTENIGSIFDAQPSQLNGNIHCTTDPSTPVLGYISVGSTQSERIFVHQRQMPAWAPKLYYPYCVLVKGCCDYLYPQGPGLYLNQVDAYINYTSPTYEGNVVAGFVPYIPIDAIRVPPIFGPIIGFTVTSIPGCVDCRTRGGINRPPSFWQN
jgi:hypothetical protein